MAIQNRRGVYGEFDPSKMVPGEFAVVQSNDPNATDGKSVYLAFAAGDVKRLATHDDMVAEITDITEDIIEEVSTEIEEAIHEDMETASAAANTATQKAADASHSAEEAAQTVATIIDATLTQTGKAADAKKTGDEIGDLKSALNKITPTAYIANASKLGIENCVPFFAKSGDVITVKTADGSAFTVHEIRFVDANKENVAYWGLVNYGSERTFTVPANKADSYYIYLNLGTAQDVTITNNSSIYNISAEISQKVTYKQVGAMIGSGSENIFSGIPKIDGKYVNYNTGTISSLENYSVTDYFTVFPGALYKLVGYASGSQIAFYDKNNSYVTGFVTNFTNITIPDNARIVKARWCGETSNYNNWGLYLQPIESIKYITTEEGLLAGIIDATAHNYKKVVVNPGTYDLIAEYKAKYGNTYFDDYTSNYNDLVNGYFDRGIWLDNIEVTFQSGSKVTAIYDGSNSNVTTYFSAFAMGQNVKIDGLVLDAKNLRYGIHPDWHPTAFGRLEIKNCDLHHYKQISPGQNDNQAIGAGLDIHSTWLIENCIFRSDTSHPVFRVHNNASSDAESKIIIKDCYIVGNGYILLNSYSTSEHQSIAQVSGCSWVNPVVIGKETQASNDNITLYSWNNETRQN